MAMGSSDEGMYGECTAKSLFNVFDVLKEKCGLDETSVFLDLGSGRGVPSLLAAWGTPCLANLGVELDKNAWRLSVQNLNRALRIVDEDEEEEEEGGEEGGEPQAAAAEGLTGEEDPVLPRRDNAEEEAVTNGGMQEAGQEGVEEKTEETDQKESNEQGQEEGIQKEEEENEEKQVEEGLQDQVEASGDIEERQQEEGGERLSLPPFRSAFLEANMGTLMDFSPATHVYAFDCAMPPELVLETVMIFNLSLHSFCYISFRRDLASAFGLAGDLVAQVPMHMTVSGEGRTAFVFLKRKWGLIRELNSRVLGRIAACCPPPLESQKPCTDSQKERDGSSEVCTEGGSQIGSDETETETESQGAHRMDGIPEDPCERAKLEALLQVAVPLDPEKIVDGDFQGQGKAKEVAAEGEEGLSSPSPSSSSSSPSPMWLLFRRVLMPIQFQLMVTGSVINSWFSQDKPARSRRSVSSRGREEEEASPQSRGRGGGSRTPKSRKRSTSAKSSQPRVRKEGGAAGGKKRRMSVLDTASQSLATEACSVNASPFPSAQQSEAGSQMWVPVETDAGMRSGLPSPLRPSRLWERIEEEEDEEEDDVPLSLSLPSSQRERRPQSIHPPTKKTGMGGMTTNGWAGLSRPAAAVRKIKMGILKNVHTVRIGLLNPSPMRAMYHTADQPDPVPVPSPSFVSVAVPVSRPAHCRDRMGEGEAQRVEGESSDDEEEEAPLSQRLSVRVHGCT
uniref:DOT1 domain-containing protein n=1 Tax=Chromera velia CCMP2878 TaxID=1169474 RepID=A0A0G4I5H8_9ALVE|eukprot:Cvel_11113.t1-p1 / transcript=Cvel_11113.t1 / gene=Cvel_11113 / organism=Chromera_velia_CCMP2878 / gene_product=hypothetical protein / transcript_product=hypothetical protein / location=Cvel_scaffold688:12885-17678(+) / protein_length=732 / sequence_SO=supercontig / SO=protein_coding / is_pseudo=false